MQIRSLKQFHMIRATTRATRRKKRKHPVSFDLKKNAGEAIEEAVFWRTALIIARSTSEARFDVGTSTAIRWKGRSFLVTAGHVVDDYSDAELTFGFRPEGTLDRDPWHEQAQLRPDQLVLSATVKIKARFRSSTDDLAALEVDAAELDKKLRFYKLDESSKVEKPQFRCFGFNQLRRLARRVFGTPRVLGGTFPVSRLTMHNSPQRSHLRLLPDCP